MMTRKRGNPPSDDYTLASVSVPTNVRNMAIQFGALAIVAFMVWLNHVRDSARDAELIQTQRDTKAAIESGTATQIAKLDEIKNLLFTSRLSSGDITVPNTPRGMAFALQKEFHALVSDMATYANLRVFTADEYREVDWTLRRGVNAIHDLKNAVIADPQADVDELAAVVQDAMYDLREYKATAERRLQDKG